MPNRGLMVASFLLTAPVFDYEDVPSPLSESENTITVLLRPAVGRGAPVRYSQSPTPPQYGLCDDRKTFGVCICLFAVTICFSCLFFKAATTQKWGKKMMQLIINFNLQLI